MQHLVFRYDIDFIEGSEAFHPPTTAAGLSFPRGFSLEAASIEPASNILFAYLCANGNEARMFKIPLDGLQRGVRFLHLDEGDDESSSAVLLRSIQSFPDLSQQQLQQCKLPARCFLHMPALHALRRPILLWC